MFGPVSGGHFNPVVSFADATFGGLRWRSMRRLSPGPGRGLRRRRDDREPDVRQGAVSMSTKDRSSPGHFLSEIVATLGLILVIFALARPGAAAPPRPRSGRISARRTSSRPRRASPTPPSPSGACSRTRSPASPRVGAGLHRRPDHRWRPGRRRSSGSSTRPSTAAEAAASSHIRDVSPRRIAGEGDTVTRAPCALPVHP